MITARGTDSILTYQVAANGTFGEGFQCAGNRTLCGHSLDVDGSGDRDRRTAAPSTTYRPGWCDVEAPNGVGGRATQTRMIWNCRAGR